MYAILQTTNQLLLITITIFNLNFDIMNFIVMLKRAIKTKTKTAHSLLFQTIIKLKINIFFSNDKLYSNVVMN